MSQAPKCLARRRACGSDRWPDPGDSRRMSTEVPMSPSKTRGGLAIPQCSKSVDGGRDQREVTHRLVGVTEIGVKLGVSRQRADQLSRTKGFPDPATDLAHGRMWETNAVETWIAATREALPAVIVKQELPQLKLRGRNLSPASSRCLHDDPPTRSRQTAEWSAGKSSVRLWHAVNEARKCDPQFTVEMPNGWLEDDGDAT